MDVVKCPNGCGVLEQKRTKKGITWECMECKGRSVAMAVLRKSVPRKLVSSLWGLARDGNSTRGIPCAHCTKRMARVTVPLGQKQEPDIGEPVLSMEVCQICHYLWIDPSQAALLPNAPAPAPATRETSDEGRQAVALATFQLGTEKVSIVTSDPVGAGMAAADVGMALFEFALGIFME